MEKKGAIRNIVVAAIILATLGALLFGAGQLLPKSAKAGDSFSDKVLDDLGVEQEKTEEQKLAKAAIGSYDSILKAFQAEGKAPCLLKYEKLPEDLRKYTFDLTNTGSGIIVQLTDNGKIVRSKTVEGKNSCIVSEENTENFKSNNLGDKKCTEFCYTDYTKKKLSFEEKDINEFNIMYRTTDGNTCFLSDEVYSLLKCTLDQNKNIQCKNLKFC
jgi:hypothetical protein